MLTGKEMLLDLLDKALVSPVDADEQKKLIEQDIQQYKVFLNNFTSPLDIVKISATMLEKLASNIVPEENQQPFIANIKFLQGLISLNNEKNKQTVFNNQQVILVEELKELIKRTISKNEFLIAILNDNAGKTRKQYQEIKDLIISNDLIKAGDYDLIEELVYKLCPSDVESVWDKVLTYLNTRNAEKLEKIHLVNKKNKLKEKFRKKTNQKKTDEKETPISIEQRLSEFIQKSRRTHSARILPAIEKAERIKQLFMSLGYSYDDLDFALKNKLLETRNFIGLRPLIRYLKEKNPIVLPLLGNNLSGLVYILTESNQLNIEKVLHKLAYVHDLSEETTKKVINLMTPIFGAKGTRNFLGNSRVFEQYQVDLKQTIDTSPKALIVNHQHLRRLITNLEEQSANVKSVLEKCAVTIGQNINVILDNILLLETYGFNLKSFFAEQDACYSLLNCRDLAGKLDQLIEMGLNETIHQNPDLAGNTLGTIIIKRVYYTFKNDIPVWESSNNNAIDTLIKQNNTIIDESQISLLIAEHPILEMLDEGCRPAIYTSTPLALLKRRTELIIGQKTFSRLKTYRVFKSLVEQGVKDADALYYAITYKSSLEEIEYGYVKEFISRVEAL